MRRMRLAGLCLVAALAVCESLPASASANHGGELSGTYRKCQTSPKLNGHWTGEYTNNTCTEVSATHEGKYNEAALGTEEDISLKGKGGIATFYVYRVPFEEGMWRLEYPSQGAEWTVACAKSKAVGAVTGQRTGWMRVTFTRCTATPASTGIPVKCSAKLETSQMPTELGTFAAEASHPPYSNGELSIGERYPFPVAALTCGSTKFELTGGIGNPELVKPALRGACSTTIELSFRVSLAGQPEVWADGITGGQGLPTTVVGETLFGTGLETTQTFKSKVPLCVVKEDEEA